MSNSSHSTSLGIPQIHFTSLVTAHHRVPHLPHHHSTSHFTSDIAQHRTYHTISHLIPHHGHIRMNKAQHCTSGIAKHCTSHHVMCDQVVLVCGMVCCAGLMWFGVKYWDVECRYNTAIGISHHVSASFHIKHHLWHYSKPLHIPRRTISQHFISQWPAPL